MLAKATRISASVKTINLSNLFKKYETVFSAGRKKYDYRALWRIITENNIAVDSGGIYLNISTVRCGSILSQIYALFINTLQIDISIDICMRIQTMKRALNLFFFTHDNHPRRSTPSSRRPHFSAGQKMKSILLLSFLLLVCFNEGGQCLSLDPGEWN